MARFMEISKIERVIFGLLDVGIQIGASADLELYNDNQVAS